MRRLYGSVAQSVFEVFECHTLFAFGLYTVQYQFAMLYVCFFNDDADGSIGISKEGVGAGPSRRMRVS